MPEVARFHATLYLPFFRRWLQVPQAGRKESERPEDPPNLYECTVCLEIVHPQCVEKTRGLGQINPDLSNSWECAKCINEGFAMKVEAPPQSATLQTAPTQTKLEAEAAKERQACF